MNERQDGGAASPVAPSSVTRSISSWLPVYVLTGLMAGLAALIMATVDRDGAYAGEHSNWMTLGGLMVLFGATEVLSVHLHFTRNSHTFSLFEIPLTLGMFFAPTPLLLLAHVIGGGLVLAFHRRQPPVKLLFNVASFIITDGAAVLMFRAIAHHSGTLGSRSTLAAGASAMTATVLSATFVIVVISLVEQRWFDRQLLAGLVFGAVTALISTSLGLIAVAMISAYPSEAWLLLVPTIGLYLANHAYVNERRRHQGLEFLHDSTRLLHQTPELESALTELLSHARAAFRAGFAELVYVPGGHEQALHARADSAGLTAGTLRLDGSDLQALVERFEHEPLALHVGHELGDETLGPFLIARGLTDAVIAPLRDDGRTCGVMIVGNRLGDVARFDREDLVVLETLASNVTVALENGRLEHSLDQLRQLERKLTHQATHDALTGLANRTLFTESVTEALANASADGSTVAVLFIDLDDFKTVNDSLGHAAGDDLLVILGRRLGHALPRGGLAARLGGDEFAVVLREASDAHDAHHVAHVLLEAVSAPVSLVGRSVPVNASIGVAVAARGQTTAEVLRNADTAMYAAKGRGKHCVAMFEASLHEAAVHRYNLTFELNRAITNREFVVHYQPIIDLARGTVVGAEALVRWEHPTLGLLMPGAFIPIAEESGAIMAIGRVVLDEVCRYLTTVEPTASDGSPLYVSVNLSARDLMESALPGDIRRTLDTYRVPPSQLVFEVTEGLMITDPEVAVTSLRKLKELGVRIALDDFGTGYSSLSQLYQLPVDILKIAQPFVDDMIRTDEDQPSFVETIVQIGHTLRLLTVAEGIEHGFQADRLDALGCQLGQGYHFARPMPEAAFTEWLAAPPTFTVNGRTATS